MTLIFKSHSPGVFFPPGERTVTYIFIDAAGNTAECSFSVTVTEGGFAVTYLLTGVRDGCF